MVSNLSACMLSQPLNRRSPECPQTLLVIRLTFWISAAGETQLWLEEAVVRVCFIAEWPRLAHLAFKQGGLDAYGRIAVEVTFLARCKSGML